MKIGIVSDSHGKTRRLAAALQELAGKGAETIVHCGDVGSAACLDALADCPLPCHVVAGNMDRHVDAMQVSHRCDGLQLAPASLLVDLPGGRALAVTHGHDGSLLLALAENPAVAYLCHGHTHRARDERVGNLRMINPGALHHPKGPRHPTCALLDTDTDTVEFLEV